MGRAILDRVVHRGEIHTSFNTTFLTLNRSQGPGGETDGDGAVGQSEQQADG